MQRLTRGNVSYNLPQHARTLFCSEENSEYCFAVILTDECEILSYTSDDRTEWGNSKYSVDEKSIICKKFTEYLTMGMVTRLSNQL